MRIRKWVYLARSFAASCGSVIVVDIVDARLAGGEGGAATVEGKATTAGGEIERLGGVPRPNTFRRLRNPFKVDSLAVCGALWSAISMRKETSLNGDVSVDVVDPLDWVNWTITASVCNERQEVQDPRRGSCYNCYKLTSIYIYKRLRLIKKCNLDRPNLRKWKREVARTGCVKTLWDYCGFLVYPYVNRYKNPLRHTSSTRLRFRHKFQSIICPNSSPLSWRNHLRSFTSLMSENVENFEKTRVKLVFSDFDGIAFWLAPDDLTRAVQEQTSVRWSRCRGIRKNYDVVRILTDSWLSDRTICQLHYSWISEILFYFGWIRKLPDGL